MGKVRPKAVKKLAEKLLEEHRELFRPDFEHNKLKLKELGIGGKRFRNRVAGYITRLLKRELSTQ